MTYVEKPTSSPETFTVAVRKRDLTVGVFYWVRMVIGEERTAMIPHTVWAPARFTGFSADTHAREVLIGGTIHAIAYSPETWDFVGFRSDDGHHFVDVMDVGPEIPMPGELL